MCHDEPADEWLLHIHLPPLAFFGLECLGDG